MLAQYQQLRSDPVVQTDGGQADGVSRIHASKHRQSGGGSEGKDRRERQQGPDLHADDGQAQREQQCSLLLRCQLPQCYMQKVLRAKTSSFCFPISQVHAPVVSNLFIKVWIFLLRH